MRGDLLRNDWTGQIAREVSGTQFGRVIVTVLNGEASPFNEKWERTSAEVLERAKPGDFVVKILPNGLKQVLDNVA